ncbi:MAG: helix-turn-helix transcriptional regulator [Bdellovibrionaceae bacterium]|nr:helix-turn-helix transcriptional regulator [Pseudobdellovibrionaceae bacterium]
MKQAELDEKANLPRSTVSKIENAKREATASELVRISQILGVTLDMLVTESDSFVYREEIKVIEALREIPFDDYKRILHTIEAQVYFTSKDAQAPRRGYLEALVGSLTQLSQADRRPRSNFEDKKRITRKD